jgi:hypothetical protein
MIFLLNQKPDTSLAQKSGHFYLLTTLTGCRLITRKDAESYNASMFNVEPQENKRSIHIPMPLSLLLVPLLFIGAGISIPFSLVYRRIQRQREHRFRLELAALGRIIGWKDLMQAVDEARGTVIEERYSLKGPVRWWWTPEIVRDLSPYETADWFTMLKGNSFRPFAVWCRQRYTSLDQGHALLVATDGAPINEVRALWSRLTAESGHRNFILVVPPESLRKA